MFNDIEKVADERNVEPVQIVGNLLHRSFELFINLNRLYFGLHFVYRASYIRNKHLAETGLKIEQGEVVQARKHLEINHCIWLSTVGAGFGKMQYRLYHFIHNTSNLRVINKGR